MKNTQNELIHPDENKTRKNFKNIHLDFPPELNTLWGELYGTVQEIRKKHPEIKSISFSSAQANEGASTLAFHTAIALGTETGQKVLLIDSNFNNPALHRFIGADRSKGLVELVQDRPPLSEVIIEAKSGGIFFMTAGRPVKSPAAFFRSNAFSNILEALEKRFDLILFDTAPVLTAPETAILSSRINGLIFVIHADKTRREVVISARQRLQNSNVTIYGAVLNKKRYYVPDFIYRRI